MKCDNATSPNGRPQWKLHRWQPGGFTLLGDPIASLDDFACDVEFYPVDINADGKLEILVPTMFSGANGEQVLGSTFSALARRADGSYEISDTALPLPLSVGRVLFADVNGDGLPDAIQSGQAHSRLVDTTGSAAGYAVGDVSLKLDDAAPEKFIAEHLSELKNGAKSFDLPEGLGRMANPDGTFTPATRARLVPSGSGVKTAFPEP